MITISIDGPGAMGFQLTIDGYNGPDAFSDADVLSLAEGIVDSDAVRSQFTGTPTLSGVTVDKIHTVYP